MSAGKIEALIASLDAARQQPGLPGENLKIQAAICALRGDVAGVEQNLAACQISAADFAAALQGKAEY